MFKKYKQLIIGFILGALVFINIPVGAAVQDYILQKSSAKLMVDGKEFANKDLPVLIMNPGYNYIPAATFREICDTIGVGFEWVGEKNEIQINTKKIMPTQEGKVDSVEKIVKDGFNLVVENGVEYVSLRDVMLKHEGYEFRHDGDNKIAYFAYNPESSKFKDKQTVIFENIKVYILNDLSHIEYKVYKENILPMIK